MVHDTHKQRGFTLIEVLIAVGITAVLIGSVLQVFRTTLVAQEEVKALGEPMKGGEEILDMVEDDLRAIWTFNIKDNRVFQGRNHDLAGQDDDRIHMICAGRTLHDVRLIDDSMRPAPYAEISYVLRASPKSPVHLELWRREDPLIDKEMHRGGYYMLLGDRLHSFNVTYYEEVGVDAEPFDDWDVAEKGTMPRRIKIEIEIDRSKDSHNRLVETAEVGLRRDKFVRHVTFPQEIVEAFTPGIALMPAIPAGAPQPENAQAGGGAAQRGANGRGGNQRDASGRGGKSSTTITSRGGNKASPIPGLGKGGRGSSSIDDVLKRIGGNRSSSGGNRRSNTRR